MFRKALQDQLRYSKILDEEGLLSRRLPVLGVNVPQCDIRLFDEEGDVILCYEVGAPFTLNTNLDGLLDSFIELSDGNRNKILRFARKWGPLRACEHFMPYGKCAEECSEEGRERIAVWQDYARRSRGILNVATNVYDGRCGDPSDWEAIMGLEEGALTRQRVLDSESAEEDGHILMCAVNYILDLAGVRLSLSWSSSRPNWELVPDGALIGALACQLAFAVAGTSGTPTCTSCGRPYVPKRKPQSGRRNYCPSCGKTAAKRDHAREKRRIPRSSEDGSPPG